MQLRGCSPRSTAFFGSCASTSSPRSLLLLELSVAKSTFSLSSPRKVFSDRTFCSIGTEGNIAQHGQDRKKRFVDIHGHLCLRENAQMLKSTTGGYQLSDANARHNKL